MGEQFEQAKKLVHNHVLYGQSLLIEDADRRYAKGGSIA